MENIKNKGSKWVVEVTYDHPSVHGLIHFSRDDYLPVMSFYARGYKKAKTIANELFGEGCLVRKV